MNHVLTKLLRDYAVQSRIPARGTPGMHSLRECHVECHVITYTLSTSISASLLAWLRVLRQIAALPLS